MSRNNIFCGTQANVNLDSTTKRCPERVSCADEQCLREKTGRIFSIQKECCCAPKVDVDAAVLNGLEIANVTNIDPIEFKSASYTRVKNIVSFSGKVDVDIVSNVAIGSFTIELPIPISSAGVFSGTGSITNGGGESKPLFLNILSGNLFVSIEPLSGSGDAQFIFQYEA